MTTPTASSDSNPPASTGDKKVDNEKERQVSEKDESENMMVCDDGDDKDEVAPAVVDNEDRAEETSSTKKDKKRSFPSVDGNEGNGDEDEEMEFEYDETAGRKNANNEDTPDKGPSSNKRLQTMASTYAKNKAPSTSPSSSIAKEEVFSPELLKIYYSRLFPFDLLYAWLSYDPSLAASGTATTGRNKGRLRKGGTASSSSSLLARREFSFTLEPNPGDEIYVRYQSFANAEQLAAKIKRDNPVKIDIGAVFNVSPKDRNAGGNFHTVQREFVLDIDLTDYDGVRHCGCSGAKICPKCWVFMTAAHQVIHTSLLHDFGFQHVMWFYSGRRGIHAWVSDEEARLLTNEQRSAVASYFEVNLGNEKNRNVYIPMPLHPFLKRSFDILEPLFIQHILPAEGHGLLATPDRWNSLLDDLPEAAKIVKDKFKEAWKREYDDGDDSEPADKWKDLKRNLDIFRGAKSPKKATQLLSVADRARLEMWPVAVVFRHMYPRIDVNVSKMQNHLLKSPFCVHPKTGRVCVPIVDMITFDPFDTTQVPTLPSLMKELNEYSHQGEEEDLQHEWQKTSLRKSFEYFQTQFLQPLHKDLQARDTIKQEQDTSMSW